MGMKTFGVVAGATLLALGAAGVASAHHSFGSEFDSTKPVKIEGTVLVFEWVNPHSWIHIMAPDANQGGKRVEWKVEGGAPSALLRRGWNRNSLPKGTKIIVTAFRARDGAARASASEIAVPDGQTLSLGNPQTEAAIAAAKRGE